MFKDKVQHSTNVLDRDDMQSTSEFCIKIWYKDHRKHIDKLPLYLNELKQLVSDNLISSECIPLAHDEFDLHFHDVSNDKCVLECDNDLRSAYRILWHCNPKCLKVVVTIRKGIRTKAKTKDRKSSDEDYLHKFNEVYNRRKDSSSSDDEDEREKLDEIFRLFKPEESKQMIIREGLTYQWERKMGNGTFTYMCEEFYTYRCTGRWKVNTYALGGEYGQLAIKHSLPYEQHAWIREKETFKKFASAMTSYCGGESMSFSKDEVKSLTKALIKKDPNMTSSQILTHIKSVIPHADMPTRKEIGNIIGTERGFLIPTLGGPGMFDLKRITTLRKTEFGRGMAFTMIDDKPRHFLFLHSDFQEKVVKEVSKQRHPHLFIDGTFKWWPRQWHQLLNIAVYHRDKIIHTSGTYFDANKKVWRLRSSIKMGSRKSTH